MNEERTGKCLRHKSTAVLPPLTNYHLIAPSTNIHTSYTKEQSENIVINLIYFMTIVRYEQEGILYENRGTAFVFEFVTRYGIQML